MPERAAAVTAVKAALFSDIVFPIYQLWINYIRN